MDARQLRVATLRRMLAACSAAAVIAGPASAQQEDLSAGAKLYVSQCKICHGSVAALDQDQAAPMLPRWQLAGLTLHHGVLSTRSDALSSLVTEAVPGDAAADRLAFAPPFGPTLRGVYGRTAGSVEGFQYSLTFMKTLKGMEWNDAALDVWITDPQAWVPGVYMFYKQRDADVRRRIIAYLKSAQ